MVVSPFSIVAFIIFCMVDNSIYPVFVYASALAHELGHIIALKVYKVPIEQLKFEAFGVCLDVAPENMYSYSVEFWVSLWGPLVNGIIALLALLLYRIIKIESVPFIVTANLGLMIVNLFPIASADGGRLLKCLLLEKMEYTKAMFVCTAISNIALIIVVLLGIAVVIISGYNLSLLVIGIYFFIKVGSAISKKSIPKLQ